MQIVLQCVSDEKAIHVKSSMVKNFNSLNTSHFLRNKQRYKTGAKYLIKQLLPLNKFKTNLENYIKSNVMN